MGAAAPAARVLRTTDHGRSWTVAATPMAAGCAPYFTSLAALLTSHFFLLFLLFLLLLLLLLLLFLLLLLLLLQLLLLPLLLLLLLYFFRVRLDWWANQRAAATASHRFVPVTFSAVPRLAT